MEVFDLGGVEAYGVVGELLFFVASDNGQRTFSQLARALKEIPYRFPIDFSWELIP